MHCAACVLLLSALRLEVMGPGVALGLYVLGSSTFTSGGRLDLSGIVFSLQSCCCPSLGPLK